eukprot:365116-Chlamydomonas_euryale.AAC.11
MPTSGLTCVAHATPTTRCLLRRGLRRRRRTPSTTRSTLTTARVWGWRSSRSGGSRHSAKPLA